jgi:hypothetical protein
VAGDGEGLADFRAARRWRAFEIGEQGLDRPLLAAAVPAWLATVALHV